MKKFIFAVAVAVGLCGASASELLAKEDGTEECDAVALEGVLKQARDIVGLGDSFSQVLREGVVEAREGEEVIKSLIAENFSRRYPVLAENKEDYCEAVRRFFGQNSRPKLKND